MVRAFSHSKINICACTHSCITFDSFSPLLSAFCLFFFLSIFTHTFNNIQDPGPAWMTATTVNKAREKEQVRRRKLWNLELRRRVA